MVSYFSSHSTKMAMRQKPVRFGYKVWMLASTSTGFPLHMEIYQGKSGLLLPVTDPKQPPGVGSGVVNRLIRSLPCPEAHTYTMDNFFTSADLMEYLQTKGIRATGTARDCRLKKIPFPSEKEIKKTKREPPGPSRSPTSWRSNGWTTSPLRW